MIDTTAEYPEQLGGGTLAGPPEGALSALRVQAEEWIDRIGTSDGLSRGLTSGDWAHADQPGDRPGPRHLP